MFENKDWNHILNNKEKFINFLSSEFNVNWVKKPMIDQSKNTISASYENNKVIFSVNSEYNKAMLKLDTCGQIKEFVLLIENNVPRTYKKSEYALNRFISFIKYHDPCKIKRDEWRRIIWAIHGQNSEVLYKILDNNEIFDEISIESLKNMEAST